MENSQNEKENEELKQLMKEQIFIRDKKIEQLKKENEILLSTQIKEQTKIIDLREKIESLKKENKELKEELDKKNH